MIEHQDSGVIVTEAQFPLGQDHSGGLDPADLAATNLHAARQYGSGNGKGDLGARVEVPGAADDFDLVPAGVDRAEPNFVGIGMRL